MYTHEHTIIVYAQCAISLKVLIFSTIVTVTKGEFIFKIKKEEENKDQQ